MADASRFPQGIVITGALTEARPVGTIVYATAQNAFYISTNATVATYTAISIGSAGSMMLPTTDPGTGAAIPVTTPNSYAISLTIAAGVAETNTLAAPTFAGQQLAIVAGALGAAGTRAITVATAINQAGNTIITFDTVRDFILLEAYQLAGALAWRVASNNGCTLS